MRTPRQPTTRAVLVLFVLIAALTGLPACASKGLPRRFEVALDEHIRTLAGTETDYEVVSAENPVDQTVSIQAVLSNQPARIGGCPPAGTKETWCVIIAPAVTDATGNSYTRFLLRAQGRYLDVEHLAETESDAFTIAGCSIWDAGE